MLVRGGKLRTKLANQHARLEDAPGLSEKPSRPQQAGGWNRVILQVENLPARIEILRTLAAAGDRNCAQLTREAGLAQSTMSEHVRVLREAGLIEACGPSARSGYCISREGLLSLKQMIVAL